MMDRQYSGAGVERETMMMTYTKRGIADFQVS
jgi:hypothetical protein